MRQPTLTFGPFAFDPHSRLLRRGDQELVLPPRVLGVLEVLLSRPGDVVSRQELMASVWKDSFVTDTSLAEAVSLLRQALGDDHQTPVYVQTLHRRGYRFVAPIAPVVTDGVSPSIGRQLVPWSVAAISAVVAVVAAWQAIRSGRSVEAPIIRFPITLQPGTRLDTRAPALALSPDGVNAAWSACDEAGCRLYVRRLDRLEAVPTPGTEGAATPFFSPDGRWVAFHSDGRLKKVALAGGAPVALADAADALGGVWTPRGRIIYAGAANGLLEIPETGGDPTVLTVPRQALGEVRHSWPSLSPSGGHLYFTIATTPHAVSGGRIGVLRTDGATQGWQTLLTGAGIVRAFSEDALVFSRAGELHGVGFDRQRLTTAGAPVAVVDSVARVPGGVQFAGSAAGTLLYAPSPPAPDSATYRWWTAEGATTAIAEVRDLIAPALSPDGARLAGSDGSDGVRGDIWIADLRQGTMTRLTHGGLNAAPVWSADGGTVYYASRGQGAFELWRRNADGSRPAERLHASEHHAFPVSSSADGALLAFVRQTPASRSDVWILQPGRAPAPLIQTPFDDVAAAFSPDGSLVAYQSNEAGRWDIFLHQRSNGRKIAVSPGGGTAPFWSRDGRLLYYSAGERLMRTAIAPGPTVHVGPPEHVAHLRGAGVIGLDPTNRVLIQRRVSAPGDRAIVAVNWIRELRQLLGPPAASSPR